MRKKFLYSKNYVIINVKSNVVLPKYKQKQKLKFQKIITFLQNIHINHY